MTDRELLELAAKAAGMETEIERATGDVRARVPNSGPAFPVWNPLTDDCDALRLAVRLKLCFGPNFDGDLAVCFGEDGRNITEPLNPDPDAATRRAIVRAAAEIGRAR